MSGGPRPEARHVHIVDELPEPLLRAREEGRAGPALVVSLDGFLDAGNAGRLTVDHLVAAGPGPVVASFDLDAFYDYRARRPPMTFVEDHYEEYAAPRLVVRMQEDAAGTPYLLLHGPEPDTHTGRRSPPRSGRSWSSSACGSRCPWGRCRWRCRTPGR
jgi:hypothetical protein